MSSQLAEKLVNAESAEAFLREQPAADWQSFEAFKGEVDRLLGCDLKAATRLAERVEQLAGLVADPVSRAFAAASRARVLHHSGHSRQADELYSQAASAMRDARLGGQAAAVEMHRVFALTEMGRYDEALQVASLARRSLLRGDPVTLAQLEINVAHVHYFLDRYKKALHHYDRAGEILSSSGDLNMKAAVDFNRSNILNELDRPEEALELLERAAESWERVGASLYAAQARFHIAYLHFLRGNYNAALASYYLIRDHIISLGSSKLAAWCDLEIAEILLALNAFDDAAESALRARGRFSELGMPYESAKASLAHAFAAMGLQQLDQAHIDLVEAREAFARSGNKTFTALTDSYLAELAARRGDHREAAAAAARSLRVFARQKLSTRAAYSRLLQARATYEMGELARAARMARAALRSVEGLFAPAVVHQCHHLLGRIERDRNRKKQSLDSFLRAVETIEQMRGGIAADEFKATFLRDKITAYEDAISACLDEGTDERLEEAFRLVESSKSRALADLLARYVRGSVDKATNVAAGSLKSETRERLSRLIEDLNWYSSQAGLEDDKGSQRSADVADRYRRAVVRCEKQISKLFRRMETEDPAFVELHRMQAASPGELRGALEPDETVIEYFTTGDQVSAFVANRDRITVARAIASKADVERVLSALRFQIEKFNYGSDYIEAHFGQLKRAADEHLSQLYRLVFAPIEERLGGSRLIIIPHGALHYVPFHALAGEAGYVVDRFEISYAPSAAVLKLCRARQGELSNNKTLVALGVAERGTPNIEEEVAALGALFPNSVTLTGDKATRDNLLKVAPRARFLHLASHGYFRRDNPMFSFLKLADSHLNFYSLLDLKLNAEMVTLSACHTGVNMIFPGDELHGLVRGFLYAGAPSLVASLWAVSDRSTADFMREMYSHIRAGETKRAALRRAQLAVKEAYGHPYYWAPFVLMGNPG